MANKKIFEIPKPVILMIVKMLWDRFEEASFSLKEVNKILSTFGLSIDTFLEHNFLLACIQSNLEHLKNSTLNKTNFVMPTLQKHTVTYIRTISRMIDEYYIHDDLEMFYLDRQQLLSRFVGGDYEDAQPIWEMDPNDEVVLDQDTVDEQLDNDDAETI